MRPSWDDDIAILSGENVSFAIETAGLGSRFAATGLDLLMQLVLFTVAAYGFGILSEGLSVAGDLGKALAQVGYALFYLVSFVIWWGYYFLFEWLANGQTPGKRALGLRVVEVSGLPVTLWSSFVRNALRAVDFLPFFYGFGALVALINPHNRRLGDLGAGTVVARERREAGHRLMSVDQAADAFLDALQAPVAAPARGLAGGVAALSGVVVADAPNAAPAATTRLSHEEWDLLAGFLRRRATMGVAARQRLARGLAYRLSAKLGHAPYPGYEEAWLEDVARSAGQ